MKMNENTIDLKDRITVNAITLAGMLDCGRSTAEKIGKAAGARIQIGGRVIYKVDAVERYLNEQISK